MDQDEQRDPQEERYWQDHCPACDSSPCIGRVCRDDQASLIEPDREPLLQHLRVDHNALGMGRLTDDQLTKWHDKQHGSQQCCLHVTQLKVGDRIGDLTVARLDKQTRLITVTFDDGTSGAWDREDLGANFGVWR